MMYTEEQRRIRDRSVWTVVQAILAPLQFFVFLFSLGLVLNYLATGDGYGAATLSIVGKTLVLYAIMVTGAVWEKEVFGQYLFAPAFFWEDAVSILVLALHTAYLAGLAFGWSREALILTALLAYASYVLNAAQFLFALRRARREVPAPSASGEALA
jgi:3-vinyl bacteriochlorophyllide hydratase